MKKHLIFTLLFSSLAGLNTTPATADTTTPSASDSQQAQLVIFRTVKLGATRDINYRLTVDGQPVGKLKADQVISLPLAAGEHVIQSNDRYHSSLALNLEAGQTLYINGSVDRHWRLNMDIAEPTAAVLKQLAAENSVATRD